MTAIISGSIHCLHYHKPYKLESLLLYFLFSRQIPIPVTLVALEARRRRNSIPTP